MISIIFCSINPTKAEKIKSHYQDMLGEEPHEIIIIQDAISLAEAYNRGLDKSKGDIIILSHDDIEFLQPSKWLSKIKGHLNSFDFIGLAGTTKLIGPSWARLGRQIHLAKLLKITQMATPIAFLYLAHRHLSSQIFKLLMVYSWRLNGMLHQRFVLMRNVLMGSIATILISHFPFIRLDFDLVLLPIFQFYTHRRENSKKYGGCMLKNYMRSTRWIYCLNAIDSFNMLV